MASSGRRGAPRAGLSSALRHGTAGSGDGRASTRLRGALVVVQVALAVVVAVSAGLVGRTLTILGDTPLGVDPDGVQVLRVFPPPGKYDSPEAALALFRRLEETMRAIPGVQHVALANHAPSVAGWSSRRSSPMRRRPRTEVIAPYRTVSPSYLATMGGALKRGRFLTDEDLTSVGSGLVVNEAFVRRFSSQGDPLGKSITVFRMAQGRADMGTRIIAPIVGSSPTNGSLARRSRRRPSCTSPTRGMSGPTSSWRCARRCPRRRWRPCSRPRCSRSNRRSLSRARAPGPRSARSASTSMDCCRRGGSTPGRSRRSAWPRSSWRPSGSSG
ncbi:MAG: ABC transporter permease [Gemmatimonadetes bacterium]|nr:ABC transporter permease [Gemmatimonadota bacterium]